MASKVHEHSLAAHNYQIQVEEMFLTMLDEGVSTSEELKKMIVGLEADNLKNGLLSPIFDAYVTLFWPIFPSVPEAAVQDINLASRLYAEHFILLDRVVDLDIQANLHSILYLKSTFLLQQSLAILYGYFPQSSPFWVNFSTINGNFSKHFCSRKRSKTGIRSSRMIIRTSSVLQ